MKKNNVLWICVVLMMAFGMSSCSSDDDDDNPIVGTWELKTLGFPGVDIEIPSDQRDVYEFCANGKVKSSKNSEQVLMISQVKMENMTILMIRKNK